MKFRHIYNGTITLDNKKYELIEFKIEKLGGNVQPVFFESNFHAAWFIIKDNKLVGPLSIDGEAIKKGVRIITNIEYKDCVIENVNKENLMEELPSEYLDVLEREVFHLDKHKN